jgi:putative FmdB family regulatory protein
MPLFDFKCSKGHYFEARTREDTQRCPTCGKDASKVFLVAPKIANLAMGVDPSMPTASLKWDKMHRDEARKAAKIEAEFEREVGRKPLWYAGEADNRRPS